MRSRALTAALLVYLALDFANPLIPGAVSFVSGEIDVVAGAQSRGPDTPVPAIAPALGADVEKPTEWREPGHPEVGASVRVKPRFTARSRPSASPGDGPLSPDDD